MSESPAEPSSRVSRRKRRTRTVLLEAALRQFAQQGVEAVTIQQITEAADVGFGTFYNYFDSKEAIHEALIIEVVEAFGEALDHIAEHVDDPAEVLAASVRYTLQRARHDATWGRFLVRSGFEARALERGLGPRILRDIQRGVRAGRFVPSDLPATLVAIRGMILSAIDVEVELANEQDDGFAKGLGIAPASFDERATVVLLRLLGLDEHDACEVAGRPLPNVELPVAKQE